MLVGCTVAEGTLPTLCHDNKVRLSLPFPQFCFCRGKTEMIIICLGGGGSSMFAGAKPSHNLAQLRLTVLLSVRTDPENLTPSCQ